MRFSRYVVIGLIFGVGLGLVLTIVSADEEERMNYGSVFMLEYLSTGVILMSLAVVVYILLAAIENGIKQVRSRYDITDAVSVTEETRILDSEGNTKEIKGKVTY